MSVGVCQYFRVAAAVSCSLLWSLLVVGEHFTLRVRCWAPARWMSILGGKCSGSTFTPPIKYSWARTFSRCFSSPASFRIVLLRLRGTNPIPFCPYPSSYPHTLTVIPKHPHAHTHDKASVYFTPHLSPASGQWRSTPLLLLILVAPDSLIRPLHLSTSLPTSGLPNPTRNCTSNMSIVLFPTLRGLRLPQTTKPSRRSP